MIGGFTDGMLFQKLFTANFYLLEYVLLLLAFVIVAMLRELFAGKFNKFRIQTLIVDRLP